MEMRALAKRVSSQAMCEFGKPLGAVFVDYLQLLPRTPGSTATTRNDEVAAISSSLKRLAMEDELNCPVFLVSQMNRGIENRQEKRPQLSDLRDSGGIEQDADVVAFVHPPLAFASENERERIRNKYEIGWEPLELIVAKNRDGKIGTVCCQIQRATGNIRASAR
jgi:replicative DNA helicase